MALLAVFGVTAGVLAVSALLGLVCDGLRSTDLEFFAAAAQIGPIFALALFVEIAVVMAPLVVSRSADDPAVRATVRILVRTNVLMLLVSEGAALYAVGAQRSTGFLLGCVVLGWVVQIALLVDTAYRRVGLHRLGGS